VSPSSQVNAVGGAWARSAPGNAGCRPGTGLRQRDRLSGQL